MIDLSVFEDSRLSYKAKGLLGDLLSRPDNRPIIIADLVKRSTDGESSVRSALRELRAAGYITYGGRQREGGKLGPAVWMVEERPISPDGGSAEN